MQLAVPLRVRVKGVRDKKSRRAHGHVLRAGLASAVRHLETSSGHPVCLVAFGADCRFGVMLLLFGAKDCIAQKCLTNHMRTHTWALAAPKWSPKLSGKHSFCLIFSSRSASASCPQQPLGSVGASSGRSHLALNVV